MANKKFRYEKQPPAMGNQEYAGRLQREVRRAQRARQALTLELAETKVKLDFKGPHLHLHLSDIHWGHAAVAYDMLESILNFALSTNNCLVTLYGDLAEGLKTEHLDTNTLHLLADPTQQILGFRELFIRPLVEQGKLVAMVSQFKSHEEWLRQYAGFNPYAILGDLGPENRVAIVRNGGLVTFRYPNGKTEVFRVYHNAGGGGSDINPVGSLRKAAASHPKRSNADVEGHFHTRGPAVSKEVDQDGNSHVWMQLAAFKGILEQLADPHAVRDFAGRIGGPPGMATIHTSYTGRERDMYPVATLSHAELLLQAATLRELTESRNATTELIGEIEEKIEGQPKFRLIKKLGRSRREDGLATKHATVLHYNVDADLPTIQMFAAGYRQGSKSADQPALKDLVEFVGKSSHANLIVGRGMLDNTLPGRADREDQFYRLLSILEPLTRSKDPQTQETANKIICWLFDGIMRSEAWKTSVIRDRNGKLTGEDENGFFPGDAIIEKLGVPLIDIQGTLVLSYPKRGLNYRGLILDAQQSSGSFDDPFRGLVRMEQRQPERKDFVVGGDMPKGGFLVKWNPQAESFQSFTAPGWLANEHNKGGKRNRGKPTPGNMGLLTLPDQRGMFPTSSLDESIYWYEALMLLYGLDKLGGYEEWMKRLSKQRRRQQTR